MEVLVFQTVISKYKDLHKIWEGNSCNRGLLTRNLTYIKWNIKERI